MTRDEFGAPVAAIEVPVPGVETFATGVSETEAAQAIEAMLDDEEPAAWESPDEDEDAPAAQRADDDAGDDEEGDDDADDEAEEGDEDGGEEAEEEVRYKVKLPDGTEQEVTLAELQSGWMRGADYTRKTQEVAAMRREVEEQGAAAVQASDAYLQRLELVAEFMAQHLTPEQAQLLQSEYVATRQAQAEHYAAEHAKHMEQQQALLLEAVPEWGDAKVAASEKRALMEYAESLGFTEADMRGATDYRAMLLLRKAMKYDQLMANGKERLEGARRAARVLQPGHRETSAPKGGKRRALKEATDRARRTGRMDDAAAAIFHLIDD